jgi:3-carboxy-cis,cis-muconate cycloisomerase
MGGMHQAQIHEMERSGAAMTLEWMILPQICETAGASLSGGEHALIQSIENMGKAA